MKKTYINPEIEVVEMQMKQAMMDSISGPSTGGSTDNETDLLNLGIGNSLWEQ